MQSYHLFKLICFFSPLNSTKTVTVIFYPQYVSMLFIYLRFHLSTQKPLQVLKWRPQVHSSQKSRWMFIFWLKPSNIGTPEKLREDIILSSITLFNLYSRLKIFYDNRINLIHFFFQVTKGGVFSIVIFLVIVSIFIGGSVVNKYHLFF